MWVLVVKDIPIDKKAKPVRFGIYYAKAYKHKYYGSTVSIFTTEQVVLLSHEYSVLSEERLQLYINYGWELHTIDGAKVDLALLEKGRSLCEEEREIIWALMLDGLTEYQACEEYYNYSHTDIEKMTQCYLPTKECLAEIFAVYGEVQ
jgi:hypothetical protein